MKTIERFVQTLRRFLSPRTTTPEELLFPLAIFPHKRKQAIALCRRKRHDRQSLCLLGSDDGLSFIPSKQKVQILLQNKQCENLSRCKQFAVTTNEDDYVMTYLRTGETQHKELVTAVSHDLLHWRAQGATQTITEPGVVVPDYTYKNQHLMFYGSNNINVATSKTLRTWYQLEKPVAEPRIGMFDANALSITGLAKINEGVLIIYDSSHETENGVKLQISGLLCSHNDPHHILWRSDLPLWELDVDAQHARAIGAVVTDRTIFAYWSVAGQGLLTVTIPNPFRATGDLVPERVQVEKSKRNPLMSPRTEHAWEAEGVFNPATLQLDGKVHFIYRAVGRNGSSSFGYAQSSDGLSIDGRDDAPAYWARVAFEGVGQAPTGFSPMNPSGGGWGGCEDPKITRLDDTIYLTYVAMPGHWPTHTAISSISVDDFRNKRWNKWTLPAMMSPPEVDSKSACLLSETIDGQYVIFHRSWPDIIVEYVSDLNFYRDDRWISPTPAISDWRFTNGRVVIQHGKWPNLQYEHTEYTDDHSVQHSNIWKKLIENQKRIKVRHNHWDSHKISLAASPIRTEHGWLAIYGGVDKRDKSRYKIGAMLLDPKRPEHVLRRTNNPILIPEHWYEHDWKPNIVYPSGNEVINGELHIYYGGGDKHICVATAPLETFLSQLLQEQAPDMNTQKVTVRAEH